MSTIDRAFIKAFDKNRQAMESTESAESSEDARAAALGMSTIWIDPSNEQRWRADQAHCRPQTSTDNRYRGAAPRRLGRPVPSVDPSYSQSVATSARPEPAMPVDPLTSDSSRSLNTPTADDNQAAGEVVLDIHTFDAIDVTPTPFAIFALNQVIAEPPPQRDPISTDATAYTSPDADHSPRSVPFVKLHDRTASASIPTAAPTFETAPASAAEESPFEAAWEVDRFEHPAVVRSLLEEEGLVVEAVAPLVDACRAGLQTLVITSEAAQQGRTTLATGLALATAKAGLRVALLDVDTNRPALADQLQLEVEMGWTEAARKGTSLQEAAIYSVADRLTLLPIIAPTAPILPTREEIVETLNTLRKSFDLIILDSAAIDMEAAMKSRLPAHQLDSALVVRDRRETDERGFEECVAALRQMGIEHIGVADNFIG